MIRELHFGKNILLPVAGWIVVALPMATGQAIHPHTLSRRSARYPPSSQGLRLSRRPPLKRKWSSMLLRSGKVLPVPSRLQTSP
jgi:hypothetical protein